MTPIRSLSIRPGEKYTPGRLAHHMALATLPNTALPKSPGRRPFFTWPLIAAIFASPIIAALAAVVAVWLFRKGVLL